MALSNKETTISILNVLLKIERNNYFSNEMTEKFNTLMRTIRISFDSRIFQKYIQAF